MRMSYPSAEGLAGPEIEIAESGTMLDSRGKFNDLKSMLDSNKENVKMEAMRRIINMVARGKDVSELFPAVVKNVAAKNLELKKLVYVYLVRYAEEQQDLALLSISTFQRGLKDPNQLIRASALRVLSSIRVQMIAPVLLLAIKESVRDMSPYVRKVAAHAIPKLFVLDAELQPQLIECIDFLLGDKRTMVLGSAVYAFEQTCPDRFDLLHRHFRLLCRAIVDVDEWGQIVMIGLLTRYARTQFLSPSGQQNGGKAQEEVGGEEEKDGTGKGRTRGGSGDEEEEQEDEHHYNQPLDPDHNLLITSVRPLLQSRNPAVVMAVAQLLYYIASHSQLSVVPRALVRLLRGPNEVQYIVLVNIASICVNTARQQQDREVFAISKNLFEPFLKSFFIRSSDTIHVKKLKLQVLTSLVTEANVQLVIRELQAYMQMCDMAELAIDAIGRCALQVPSAADCCLAALIRLLSNPAAQEPIVCASVVVLKRLLHSDAPLPLLRRLFRLFDSVKAPLARACILWLVGMHIGQVPRLAPDLLRKVAKSFCNENECVKLQSLNLAVRLWVTEPTNRQGKCALLVKYIFQLAHYDRSYDLRDRCRFLCNFLFGQKEVEVEENGGDQQLDGHGALLNFPLEIFLSERPAPAVQNSFADRAEHFQLGTLSHLLNQKCAGYTELPDFPLEQPDPTIRRSAYPLPSESPAKGKGAQLLKAEEAAEEFSSEEDEEEEEDVEGESDEDDEEEEESEEEEEESDEEEGTEKDEANDKKKHGKGADELSSASSSTSSPVAAQGNRKKNYSNNDPATKEARKDNNDDFLLLDLDFGPPMMSVATTTPSTCHQGVTTVGIVSKWRRANAQWTPDDFPLQLVSPVMSGGLTINGRFCRSPCLFSSSMICLELQLSFRHSQLRVSDVQLSPAAQCSLQTSGPVVLTGLGEGERRRVTLGIDFGDSSQTSEWTVKWANGERRANFQVQPPYGEQLEAIDLAEENFLEQRTRLVGMNQQRWPCSRAPDSCTASVMYKCCNCKKVAGLKLCFAAQTVSRKQLVLISFVETGKAAAEAEDAKDWCLQVNCEDIAFASILGQQLAQQLQ